MISLYKFLVAVGVSTCATGALLLIIALMTDHWAKADFKYEEKSYATNMHWGLWTYCINGFSPIADTGSTIVTVKPRKANYATTPSPNGDRHGGYQNCDNFNLTEVPGIMHLVRALLLTATFLLACVAYGAVSGRLLRQRKNPGPREEILCLIIACLGFAAVPTYTSSYQGYEFEHHAFLKIKTPEQDWSLEVLESGSALLLAGSVFTAVILRLGRDRFNRNKAEQRRRARIRQLDNERALLSFSPTELPQPHASTTPSTSLSMSTPLTTTSTPTFTSSGLTLPHTLVASSSPTGRILSATPTPPSFPLRPAQPTSSGPPTQPTASQGSRQLSLTEPTAPPPDASPWVSLRANTSVFTVSMPDRSPNPAGHLPSRNSHGDPSGYTDAPPSYDELSPRQEEEESAPPPSYEQALASIYELED